MFVDKPNYVDLRVTKENVIGGENITIGKYMTANLYGYYFDITFLGQSTDQIVSDKGFTTWEWRVVPKRSGNQTLELVVSIRSKLPNNGEELTNLVPYKREIIIGVDYPYWFMNALMNNWMFILGFIACLVLQGTVNLISNRKK